MKDAIKATASFFCHHIVPFIVFCLAGAGVLITIVLGRDNAENTFRSADMYEAHTRSRYILFIDDANEREMKAFLEDFKVNFDEELTFLTISGMVEVRLDTEIMPEIGNNRFFVEEDDIIREYSIEDALVSPARLTAIFPTFLSESAIVEDGEQNFSGHNPELMYISGFKAQIDGLYSLTVDAKTSYFERGYLGGIIVNDSESLIPISQVYVPFLSLGDDLYTAFEDYYYFSRYSDRVVIQFDAPLSEDTEKGFISTASMHFNINEVAWPYEYSEETVEHYNALMNINRVVSFLCMLGIFLLFRYIIKLRQNEFLILKMLGATRIHIIKQMLLMLVFSVVGALFPAVCFLIVLKQGFAMYGFLEYLSLYQFIENVMEFIGVILLCAVVYFIVDIVRFRTPASEEIL